MNETKRLPTLFAAAALAVAASLTSGCSPEASVASAPPGITPKMMADALHAVLESDRTVYTRQVVNRLQNEEKVIRASEHWEDDKALPLPAQMFRMGAEMVAEKNAGFSYALLSEWPINKQNVPKTDAEKTGLKFVAENKGTEPYYAEEELGGKKYFTAVYADTGVAQACISCHNNHDDTPRDDFKLGDVMGGVVIRIPVGE
jgi:hypothetical protein